MDSLDSLSAVSTPACLVLNDFAKRVRFTSQGNNLLKIVALLMGTALRNTQMYAILEDLGELELEE